MKIGDLVSCHSTETNDDNFIVTDLEAHDLHTKQYLPHCVMVAIPEQRLPDYNIVWAIIPLTKKCLKVISSS